MNGAQCLKMVTLLDTYHHKCEVLLRRTDARDQLWMAVSHRVIAIAWKENIQHHQSQELQNAAMSRKSDADTFMGHKRTNFGPLYREGHNSKQYPLK